MTVPSLVSIVIPAFNQLQYCRQCIDSVRANTRPPYKLILVDNGSTDGVGEFFDSVPDATVVHSPTNLGFAGGVNLGLAQAEGHVVLLNSDTLTPAGWLERLERALLSDDKIGMAGPMSNCVSGAQQIENLSFSAMDEINRFAQDLEMREAGKLRDVTRLVGFCLMIRDAVVREIGLFDEAYGIGNFEDDDYCLRVLRAGYRLVMAEDAFVFHYGSRTFVGMELTGEKWNALIKENEKRFVEKWQQNAVDQSAQLNSNAKKAVENGDLVGAVRLLKQAIEMCPQLDVNYNDLGCVAWQLGDKDHAFDYFSQALRLNPQSEEARENFQKAAEALEKTERAEEILREHQASTMFTSSTTSTPSISSINPREIQ